MFTQNITVNIENNEHKNKHNKSYKKTLLISSENINNENTKTKFFNDDLTNVKRKNLIETSPQIRHVIVENDDIPKLFC